MAITRESRTSKAPLLVISISSLIQINRIAKSPIFDPVTGFGGDGVLGTYTLPSPNISTVTFPQSYRGCVLDGPFSADKYTVHLGPGTLTTKHCLVRGINETLKHAMTTDVLEEQLRIKTFAELRATIDNPRALGMHITTHSAIGGEMKNVWSSPGGELIRRIYIFTLLDFFAPINRTALLPEPHESGSDVVALAMA
jgi:hypothetical protein